MILSGAFHVLSLLPTTWNELIDKFDMSIVWAFAAVIAIVIIIFIWNLSLTPYRTYKKQQSQIAERDRQIVELKQQIRQLREKKIDMNGLQVLEYMAKHSGLETKREIESALATAAARGLITVEAMALNVARVLPVRPEVFETYIFILEPEMGGRICREDYPAYALYHLPMFCRAEIEFHWPPKESR